MGLFLMSISLDRCNFIGIVQQGNVGKDTSLVVNGLEYLTSYYWRVRTIGVQDTSDYWPLVLLLKLLSIHLSLMGNRTAFSLTCMEYR